VLHADAAEPSTLGIDPWAWRYSVDLGSVLTILLSQNRHRWSLTPPRTESHMLFARNIQILRLELNVCAASRIRTARQKMGFH
jgi:hypothetical protein